MLLAFAGCNYESGQPGTEQDATAETGFNIDLWKTKEDGSYPYRESMVDEILYNDTIRSLNKNELLQLLGEPDRINENYLYYTVSQKRLGSWPLHTRSMVIKLSENNDIEWIKIHE